MEKALYVVASLGLVGHQLFKRFETFSIPVHLSFLCIPPLLGALLFLPALSPLLAVLASTGTYLASLITATLLYRISPFHPLARYPGPLWCKLSKFWMAGIGFNGHQHIYIQRLHERYGDVVRTGPNEVSIRDASAIHPILTSCLPRGPMLIGRFLRTTDLPIVAIISPEEHQERRKPWQRGFSGSALKVYEPMVAERAHQLLQSLEQRQQGEVDLSEWFDFFSFDVMSDMAYGDGSGLLKEGRKNDFAKLLNDGLPLGTFLSHVPWLGPYVAHVPMAAAKIRDVLAYSENWTRRRLERGSKVKDLFHYLSNEDQPGKVPPPMKQVVDDGIIAIVAGSDTSSSALTSIFLCLMTHPESYARLEKEIDRFYPPGQDPCDPRFHREMHYLNAVINEGLRIYPPVPGGSQRKVPPDSSGVVLGPVFLPPGTSAFVHTYSVQRDPRNFAPHPEAFWPERWLLASGQMSFAETRDVDEGAFVHNDAAFLPFSYGPRNCVGKNLALLEIRVVLCAVLQKFRVRLREGWDAGSYGRGMQDHFVVVRPSVPAVLTPRF
ncbi:high nitrogen upregulated cytochrome P450 monooxygenase 2 [Trametes punicea]|nr:high nitrogen upregulated cytochrome P450 monooxygenase 2 [Trametes punicea]